ncbi:low molecular weight phosphatase family protein [Candidatus Bipolaricaulota bacterium]|nr:low molecular weight phosphatase family protein [Candidatus Bipolaricaulota bacterium]
MASAFARQKVKEKDLPVRIISGGTDPANSVHEVVVEAMEEKGFDLSSNEPTFVEPGELDGRDYVITMGCSATGVCPASWGGTDLEWDLDDPGEAGIEKVRKIRDEIESRVDYLLELGLQDSDYKGNTGDENDK